MGDQKGRGKYPSAIRSIFIAYSNICMSLLKPSDRQVVFFGGLRFEYRPLAPILPASVSCSVFGFLKLDY